MSLPEQPGARHAAIAARFQATADGVRDWDVPTPVPEWTARDIVRHLVEWAPGLLATGSGVEWPAGPPVDDDPAAAFAHQADVVQGILDDPAKAGLTFSHEFIGTMPLGEAIAFYYTPDVFMHTWDLARATGQDDTLDADVAAELDAGFRSQGEMIRASGQFGTEQPVADDARAQERLMAFVGRDPRWSPKG